MGLTRELRVLLNALRSLKMAIKPDRGNAAKRIDRRDNAVPSSAARIDPYLKWAIATDFAYLGGDSVQWYPVLLQLAAGVTAAEFWSSVKTATNRIRVASIYERPPRDIAQISFCTALVTRETLTELFGNPGKRLPIARFELGSPVVPAFNASPLVALSTMVSNPPNAAIVAVIDDGLAFAHQRFRDAAGGTRFKYFWNQDDNTGVNPPPGFGWGRELRQGEINTLLNTCTRSGIVDEEKLYRLAGQTLAARRAKHGTHVMDLACGLDPQQVTAQSPYLIGVQLPRWVTTETSGGLLTPAVLDALGYILQRADEIAAQENTAPLPIVVNLSYGTIAGPHDGTALLEEAIDQLIASRATPLRVVLPTGNHYLARCHARFAMAAATPLSHPVEPLQWRVQPDNQSPSFVEIWLPHSQGAQPLPKVEVRVTTPDGTTSPWIGPGADWSWPSITNVRFYMIYVDPFPAGSRPRILLAMAPTAELSAAPQTAPSGTWRIEVKNNGRAIRVDAWVQRGDTPPGYPLFGRQSRFDDPRYVRFDLAGAPEEDDIGPSTIKRRGTLNALATGRQAIVIGGFRRSDYKASRYSGAGPIIDPPSIGGPWRDGPDATAVSDDSSALYGVLAAGTRTGSMCAMNGSSVAAPQIARLIAGLMTAGLASDRTAVQVNAKLVDPAPPLPPQRGGAGRIPMPPRNPKRWTRW
jgi:hypothetical protein